jgi:hypothetical protein
MNNPETEKAIAQYPYRAVICGEEYIVNGWRGSHLLTNKGEFVFSQLFEDNTIYSARILEVSLVRSDGDDEWLINGHNRHLLQSMPAGGRFACITYDENLRVYREQICAAAWIQTNSAVHLTSLLDSLLETWKTVSQPIEVKKFLSPNGQLVRGIGNTISYFTTFKDWGNPIWLTKFHPAAKNNLDPAEMKKLPAQPAGVPVKAVKSTKHKTAKVRQPKPVARFENEFSVAIIPKRNGQEIPLTIEAELQNLIKKIIAGGGNVPRTKLRSGKSDTYQPEKLLVSKIAKQLINARLLGKNKSGRTTVFWAKQRAG